MDGKYLMRPCWLEIDLDAIKSNYQALRDMVGPQVTVMPAIKANAYGHGIVEVAKALEECNAEYLALGVLQEAIQVRESGVKSPIMLFINNTITEVADLYVRYDLMPTVRTIRQVEAMAKAAGGKTVKVFIKLETGRGRLGIPAGEVAQFVKDILAFPNIQIEGMYSHLTAPDWPDKESYSRIQAEIFSKAVEEITALGVTIPFLQLANSSGSIAIPEIRMTAICPGQCMWGYSTVEERPGHPKLKNAIVAWKSQLVDVKEVEYGKFGENFAAVKLDRPKRIGVIVGGLSDGISALQAKGGSVLVRGKRVPVASSLCVEHTIIDLSDVPDAAIGDEVVILGEQGDEKITFWDLLKTWNRNVPEFLVCLPSRLHRVYIKDGKKQKITWTNKSQAIIEE